MLEASKDDIKAFIDGLACNPGGKHAYFRAIRAFYSRTVDEELIERSPIDRMKAPKVPKPLRHAVSLEAVSNLVVSISA